MGYTGNSTKYLERNKTVNGLKKYEGCMGCILDVNFEGLGGGENVGDWHYIHLPFFLSWPGDDRGVIFFEKELAAE